MSVNKSWIQHHCSVYDNRDNSGKSIQGPLIWTDKFVTILWSPLMQSDTKPSHHSTYLRSLVGSADRDSGTILELWL